MNDPRHIRLAVIAILALTALRVGVLAFSQMPVHGDEAQYWTWAKDLDLGYYSKPPMIGWVIAATTALMGDAPWALRLGAPLLHGGTALLILLTAAHAFGPRVGAWSGITYALLPGVTWASTLMSTDTPLLFFIALATYFYMRGKPLGTGLGVGLGFLSKYAMSYWVIGALIDQIFRKDRMTLPMVLGAAALAVAVFSPNIFWNMGQDFVTVAHLGENANLESERGGFAGLFEFIGSQFGVFGPLTFAALLAALATPATWTRRETRTLALLALPPLLVVCAQGFLSRANANWAAAAFVPAVPLVVQWALIQVPRFKFILPATLGLHGLVAALVAVIVITPTAVPYRPLEKAYVKLMVGPDLGREVAAYAAGKTFSHIVMDDRMSTASLLYYGRDADLPPITRQPHATGAVHDHYQMTRPFAACAATGPVLYIKRHKGWPEYLAPAGAPQSITAGRYTYTLTPAKVLKDSCND